MTTRSEEIKKVQKVSPPSSKIPPSKAKFMGSGKVEKSKINEKYKKALGR